MGQDCRPEAGAPGANPPIRNAPGPKERASNRATRGGGRVPKNATDGEKRKTHAPTGWHANLAACHLPTRGVWQLRRGRGLYRPVQKEYKRCSAQFDTLSPLKRASIVMRPDRLSLGTATSQSSICPDRAQAKQISPAQTALATIRSNRNTVSIAIIPSRSTLTMGDEAGEGVVAFPFAQRTMKKVARLHDI